MRLRIHHLIFYLMVVILLILLKVKIASEILSFLFYSLVPGFLVYNLIVKKSRYDSIIDFYLSLSLSLIFIMMTLLLINLIGNYLNIPMPLSFLNIVFTVNFLILILLIVNVFANNSEIIMPTLEKDITTVTSLLIILLGLIGIFIFNYYKKQLFVWVQLFIWVGIIFIIIAIIILINKTRYLSKNSIRSLLFAISLVLLFNTSLVSNHLIGWDIHAEYAVFENTFTNKIWKTATFEEITSTERISQFKSYNANPSITLLPTFFATIFNLPNNEYIFKFFFQLYIALIPVILFDLFCSNFSKICSTVACIFVIIHFPFFEVLPALIRQGIAYLFYVVLFLLIFANFENKLRLIPILAGGVIISHYSSTLIMLIFLIGGYIIYLILKFILNQNLTKEIFIFYSHKKILLLLCLILVLVFIWFVYIPVNSVYIIKVFSKSVLQLNNYESLDPEVADGLGLVNLNIISRIGSIVGTTTRLIIIIGFFRILYDFIKQKFNIEIKNIIYYLISFFLLFIFIFMPSFAREYNLNRIYLNVLFFLAPLFYVGLNSIFGKMAKVSLVTTSLLIITHLSFQAGIVSTLLSDTNHPRFDINGDSYLYYVITEGDIQAVAYLKRVILPGQGILINGLNEHNKLSQYLGDFNPEKIYLRKYTDSLWPDIYYYNDRYSIKFFDSDFEQKTKNDLIYSNTDSRIYFLRE